MSDRNEPRQWRLYIDDMIVFARKTQAYTEGLDQQQFTGNQLVYDATLRNIERIGEAATRIPASVRAQHPEVPWRLIVATRNQLIHAYLGIDNDTVWSIIRDDLPPLLASLRKVAAACDNS